MKIVLGTFVPFFLVFIVFSNAAAQDLDDVTITGRIVDANAAPIAGATVTATMTTTGVMRSAVTNDDGRYRFIELPPGIYSLKASMQGFANHEKTSLIASSGQNVQLDFTFQPAGVTAETIISLEGAYEPVIDSTRTIVGSTIDAKQIEEIPNVSRNALDLVLTLGGTSEEQLSTNNLADDRNANPRTAPLEQGNFSIGGGTAYSNNITIDGLDNNDDRSSRERFQPSIEAIAEFQVIQNQFSAEYGRAAGGRVNIRTRGGGNEFRGRVFGFFRDASLNANTWYNNSRAIPRPPLQETNYGFWFSGPVILPQYNGRQRTFFAVAYEFNNLADTTEIDAYVPVTANPRYELPESTGGGETCEDSTPTACTSVPPTAAYLAPYRKLYSTPNRGHALTARIDHRLFRNNDLSIGFQFGRKNNRRTTGAAATRIENAFQAKNVNTDAINFTDNQVLGASVVNQLRGQWSRFKPSFQTPNPLDPVVLISYRDPVANSARTLVAGNSTTSTLQNFADSRNETRWQLQDSITFIKGRHTFKTGFDIQDVVSKVNGLGDASGTFNFGSVLSYTQNVINRYRQNFGTGQDVRNRYYGFYLNDEFKPFSNLTVSAGLRYERETAISDTNNWGPRFGLAWDPFKKGKDVVRFGAAIVYNRALLRTVGDSIQNGGGTLVTFDTNAIGTSGADSRRVAILNVIATRFPNRYASVAELRTLVTAACTTVVAPLGPCTSSTGFSIGNVSSAGNPLRSVESDLKIPESYQFNLGFEREIFTGWVFEANYTWNKTVRLWRDYNSNAPRLPTGYADWTAYLLANPFDLSPMRRYTFYLGATNDPSGIATTPGGTTNCTTTTVHCFVNLNTVNPTATIPLVAVAGQNNNATGAPVGIATAAIARFRPDQTVSETSLIGSRGRSQYHGVVLGLRSSLHKLGAGFGAQYRFVYTLSSTKDDGLNNTSNAEVNGDFAREWARSLQDRHHRLAFSGSFDTPWWLGKLRYSPLVRWGSSAPFNVGAGGSDRNLDDLGTDRLNFSGRVKDIKYRKPGSPVPDALLAQFSFQPIGAASGNSARNAGTGPMYFGFDLNVSREFVIGDRLKLRPVIEFNNIFNAAVFSYGAEFVDFQALSSTLTAAQTLARQNFLVPTRTHRQREIRVGFRLDF